MPRTVKVAVVGLGSVGQAVTRLLLQTPAVKVVGAADPAPATADKDLGVALGLPRRLRIKVHGDPERFIKKGSLSFAKYLLKEAKVAVSPGIGFGEGGDAAMVLERSAIEADGFDAGGQAVDDGRHAALPRDAGQQRGEL